MTTPSQASVFVDDRTTEAQEKTDTPTAEIVVKGRNVEVPDHFRVYVSEKLSRLERFDPSIFLFDVELHHEPIGARGRTASASRSLPEARGR